ncbi:hypothetical protein DDF67_10325 [Caulobacter endophyticus]|uniref:Uncharacterized protein n=2 Tax=Caulobacter endophyticus TaxID=2172652 RepID=A0A2T9K304_9CAUL|nr:hypothetical protein DDF67_10325 [Caulobacter endophyticus]
MLAIAAGWIAMAAMSASVSALYYIAYADRYGVPANLYTKLGAVGVIALSVAAFVWGMTTLGKKFPGQTFKAYWGLGAVGFVIFGTSWTAVRRQAFTVLGLGYFETALAMLTTGLFVAGLWIHLEILHFRKNNPDYDPSA